MQVGELAMIDVPRCESVCFMPCDGLASYTGCILTPGWDRLPDPELDKMVTQYE